jgi:predicted PurR-regulated permease PerM
MPEPQSGACVPRGALAVVNYVLVIGVLIAALVFVKAILISALIGIGIGAILAPALQRLQHKYRIPRTVSAIVLVALIVGVLGGIGYVIFLIGETQIASLTERMPDLAAQLQARADGIASRYPWINVDGALSNAPAAAQLVGAKLFRGAWSGFGLAGALVFSFVIGLYTAVEARYYRDALVGAFPPSHRAAAAQFAGAAARTIRLWFAAQLIDMAIIGTLTSIGLWIAGVDYWLLFGVLTGVLGIIPYAGIAIVVGFATLVTMASDISRVPWLIGVFFLTQQIEGHVVLPLVMRDRARLPAVPLLVFMLVMASWGGLLGVLMAPALFAVLLLAYRQLYQPAIMRSARPEDPAGETPSAASPDF